MLHVREIVPSNSTLQAFVRYPLTLYKDDPNYSIPSLRQQTQGLLGRHNSLISNGVQTFLMAYDGERPVGRLLAGIDFRMSQRAGERQGYLSMFECEDNQAAADALFKAAEVFLKMNSIASMTGPKPMMFDDFGAGILVDGFEQERTFLSPYNLPYYAKLFENAGFAPRNEYYAYRLPLDNIRDTRYEDVLRRAEKRFGYTVKNIDVRRDLKNGCREFARVMSESMEPEWGEAAPTSEALYYELKWIRHLLWPDYMFMAYAGDRPVGLLVAIPDFNPLMKGLRGNLFPVGTFRMMFHKSYIRRLRTVMLYVVPEYQNKGVETIMIMRALAAARTNGIHEAEAAMINSKNLKLQLGVEKLGGTVTKVFRQYTRPLL